ncbi:hypothetical protein LINPERPRIM_LOCUS12488 [Linum perenne]
MDLANGREDFSPKPDETRRLVCTVTNSISLFFSFLSFLCFVLPIVEHQIKSYYGVSRNLLVKFKDDSIDETFSLAQALPDVPPAMADAVNRGSEIFTNLAVGTPWETVAKEVGYTLGSDNRIVRAQASKDLAKLVDVIMSWMASNAGPMLK